MKKILIVFLFFFIQFTYAQKEKISIEFKETNLLNAIKILESKTNYRFFYLEEWFNNKDVLTIHLKDTSVKQVLDFIFKNTDINYFLLEKNKIILTKNSRIFNSVYKKSENTVVLQENSNPIFLSNENGNKQEFINTISIGKEKNRSNDNFYTLSGIIKSATTKKGIPGLILLERDKNINTTTNKNGFYSIKLPYGVNYLETILTGIENAKNKVIIYGNGKYNFILKDEFEQLDEIIVKGNTKSNIKSVVTGVTQIKLKNIKTIPLVLGERDILKVATTLPGIKSAGEGADGINVRGGKSDQNLFLLDNSVLYNPTHFLGLFSAINPFVTKDLKVYKGYIPAEYNGRISSVFDIISKESNTKKFSGEASIGPVTGNVSLEIPIVKNKSGLILGARGTYSNWLLKAVNNKTLNNSSASFYDIMAKYDHKINENNSVRLSTYYSNDEYSIASDTTNSYGNKILAISWKHKFNDKNSGEISLSNSNYFFDIDYENESNKNFNLKYNIDETNVKLKIKYNHSKKHKIDYGITSKLYAVLPGEISPTDENSIISPFKVQEEKAIESAVFASDNFKVNNKLSINLGASYSVFAALGKSSQRLYAENNPKNESTVIGNIEYDNNEVYKTYNGLSFRFSTRYSLTESTSLKASFNNSYQFIHRLTNNTSASPTDTWKLSDSNIKPQEATQASLGLYKNINVNEYEFSVEGYYKEFTNILDYKIGASLLLNEHIEADVIQGVGKSYGIEFLMKKNIGRLNGWIGYSYSRSLLKFKSEFLEETINNGKYFPSNFDKPHDVNIVANYKLTKRFSLSANFNYQTGRPITYPTGKYILGNTEYLLYSDRNKFRIPDYYRLDLGFNIEGNHKVDKIAHSFWNISVYNVLGRSNPYSIFFVTEKGSVQGYQNSIFSKPIPTITYNIKF